MKRLFSIVLIFLLILSVTLPLSASATAVDKTVIYFPDGSSLTTTISILDSRATNTRIGNKEYIYSDPAGEPLWMAVLTGNFSYNGFTAYCGSASCEFTIYNNAYSVTSESTTKVGATATAEWTMIKKFLGVTVETQNHTLTLTCDKDGNLS